MEVGFESLNWIAVVVSAVTAFLLGGIWFHGLFGKAWVAFNKFSEADIAEMKRTRPAPVFYGTMILAYFVMAVAFAVILEQMNITTSAGGATVGAVIGLGFAVTIAMTDHITSNRHVGVFYINVMFQLVFLMAMGAILGGWQ